MTVDNKNHIFIHHRVIAVQFSTKTVISWTVVALKSFDNHIWTQEITVGNRVIDFDNNNV